MTTSETWRPATTTRWQPALLIGLRIIGALLLLGMAWLHYFLWQSDDYSSVNVIGPLFLVNVVIGVLLAGAVCTVPNRVLGVTAALSSLFTLGTLAALLVSMVWSLFGFRESTQGPLVKTTIAIEALGVIVLAVLAALGARRAGMWRWLPGGE
jgi:hypothetical protein